MSPTPRMLHRLTSREELEGLFLQNLPLLERILSSVARRHRLLPDDIEEFRSWAKMRIIAHDYEMLSRFRGEAALPTYLTSVAAALLRDYRYSLNGRWRSSAAADRLGPLGVQLERLLVRDGLALRQAGEMLRTARVTVLGDRALATMAAAFPRRRHLRPIEYLADVDACADLPHNASTDGDDLDDLTNVAPRLMRALSTLPHDERLLIELVFWEKMSVADVSRRLQVPQKPLYRRMERALARLRRAIESGAEGAPPLLHG